MCGAERAIKDRALPHCARSLLARSHAKQGGMLCTSDTSEVEKGVYHEESHFIYACLTRWLHDRTKRRIGVGYCGRRTEPLCRPSLQERGHGSLWTCHLSGNAELLANRAHGPRGLATRPRTRSLGRECLQNRVFNNALSCGMEAFTAGERPDFGRNRITQTTALPPPHDLRESQIDPYVYPSGLD